MPWVLLLAICLSGTPECAILPHLYSVLLFVVTRNFYFRIYTPSGSETSRRNLRQRRLSSRPAEVDICWEAAGGCAYVVRLRH